MLARVVGPRAQEKLSQAYRWPWGPRSAPGTKKPPEGGSCRYTALRGSADYIGFFAPPLYVYRVVAAFFSSPFGSKAIVEVTPLKLVLASSLV